MRLLRSTRPLASSIARSRAVPAAVAVAAVAALALPLNGCSALKSGPTCDDFVNASDSEKADMAKDWADDNGGEIMEGSSVMYVPAFLEYCTQDGNGDDQLSDLEFTF